MATAQPKIGLFAGIFNTEGKLLIKRRPKGISLAGEWDLPGGAVEEKNNQNALDERIVGQELAREVKEEVGLAIPEFLPMPAMYPTVLRGGGDWAFAILVGVVEESPSKGETRYISPQELQELAEGPEGNRLVSGWGKRMCRLCLRLFASRDAPNQDYAKQAGEMLAKIQSSWSN